MLCTAYLPQDRRSVPSSFAGRWVATLTSTAKSILEPSTSHDLVNFKQPPNTSASRMPSCTAATPIFSKACIPRRRGSSATGPGGSSSSISTDVSLRATPRATRPDKKICGAWGPANALLASFSTTSRHLTCSCCMSGVGETASRTSSNTLSKAARSVGKIPGHEAVGAVLRTRFIGLTFTTPAPLQSTSHLADSASNFTSLPSFPFRSPRLTNCTGDTRHRGSRATFTKFSRLIAFITPLARTTSTRAAVRPTTTAYSPLKSAAASECSCT
mmetsp:Transcript_16976/g.43272  ORF Transcript_16976/g.43272 Transcript_16976/m.43272 type:complete len:272 (-) Transcript_16976:91-906(-)